MPAAASFPTPTTKRIGLVGDTHKDIKWMSRAFTRLTKEGVDVIVQLGDFGWWPTTEWEPHYDWHFPKPDDPNPRMTQALLRGMFQPPCPVEEIADLVASIPAAVCFIDGNHENHTALRERAEMKNPDGDPSTPVEMYPGLWYLPRGAAWEWHGVRFRALGGAFSPDKNQRTPGFDWFSEEQPTWAEAERTIAAGAADVLLTHDHPEMGFALPGIEVPEDIERSSQQVRELLAGVVEGIEPKLVFHGHWHHRHTWHGRGITVEGLACNNNPGSVAVLDLDSLNVRDVALS